MKRYLIIYQGVVQGVGFRGRLMFAARKNNLTGFCKNLSNGDVSAEVQGEKVDEFVKDTIQSDGFIQVYDYSVKEIDLVENESNFTVKF